MPTLHEHMYFEIQSFANESLRQPRYASCLRRWQNTPSFFTSKNPKQTKPSTKKLRSAVVRTSVNHHRAEPTHPSQAKDLLFPPPSNFPTQNPRTKPAIPPRILPRARAKPRRKIKSMPSKQLVSPTKGRTQLRIPTTSMTPIPSPKHPRVPSRLRTTTILTARYRRMSLRTMVKRSSGFEGTG